MRGRDYQSAAPSLNVLSRDWLMGQGYLDRPADPDQITRALDAADIP